MPRSPIALVCACLLTLPAQTLRANPSPPAEVAAPPPEASPPDPAVTEAAIDDAYDDGFWHGAGPPLIVAGGLMVIPGLTGAIAGAVEGRGDVLGVAAGLLALAGAQIGFGAWFVLDPPREGPAAARAAGYGAGSGFMRAFYGVWMAAGLVSIFTSDQPISDYGGELLAVPITLLLLGFGTADYVSGKRAHRALVDGARPRPVSGLRHIRPDDRPRPPVVTLLSGAW